MLLVYEPFLSRVVAVACQNMPERVTMHSYEFNALRFGRLLAAMVTLPPFDEVPYECNGVTACQRAARCRFGSNRHDASFCADLEIGMVLELADLALQLLPSIERRMAAWQAFARQAIPSLGLGSFVRLAALLRRYEAVDDGELALLLWHGSAAEVPGILQATAALRSLVLFLQKQGITTGDAWQAWCGSAQAVIAIRKDPLLGNMAAVLLWQSETGRHDVPWVLAFARRVLGKASVQGHMLPALRKIASVMELSTKALARRVAMHERLCHAIDDVPVLRLWWWRCVKRELRAQLPQAVVVQLQVQGSIGALPLGRAIHLRQGKPMLTAELSIDRRAAPAATVPVLTQMHLRQIGWGPGLGLELLMQGEGMLPATLQHAIAARFEATQLHAPLFDRLGSELWSISCAWCEGLWQPAGSTLAEMRAWARDAALTVLEHLAMLTDMLNSRYRG